ncbi:MAG: lysozyme [Chelatococcus sp.]|nr:MAG: lysozyme [Chelatococcus sp.]
MASVLSLRPRTRLQKGTAAAALAISVVGGFEGLRQTAYRDVVGVPTICYGETRGVTMGMSATKAECDAMLLKGLQEFEQGVLGCTTVEMPVKRQVAMVSFAYNVGVGAYCKSSVARLLNGGQTRAACDALLKWNKAGGVVFPGLTRRRQAERELCLAEAA